MHMSDRKLDLMTQQLVVCWVTSHVQKDIDHWLRSGVYARKLLYKLSKGGVMFR